MIQQNLNRKLAIACFAVALGSAFSLRSVNSRFHSNSKFLNVFKNEDKNSDKFKVFFEQVKSDQQIWYYLAIILGFLSSWPFADNLGRKGAIIFSVILRCVVVIVVVLQNILFHRIDFNLQASNLAEGFYHGLLENLGLLYIYEISPKLSREAASLSAIPVIGFYMLLRHLIAYLSLNLSLAIISATYWSYYIILMLSMISGLSQLVLLVKFYPESPAFLVVKRGQLVEAKNALSKLRENENVSEELEEIQKQKYQLQSLKRSSYLVMIFLIGLIYQAVLTSIGMLELLFFGISLWIIHAIYFSLVILAFLLVIIIYGRFRFKISEIKGHMFCAYLICSGLFLLASVLLLVKFNYPNALIDISLIIIAGISTIVMSSFPAVVTTVVVLDYPNLISRAKNLVLSIICGCILYILVVFLFIIIIIIILLVTDGLVYYVLAILPGLQFYVLVSSVWKLDRHLDVLSLHIPPPQII